LNVKRDYCISVSLWAKVVSDLDPSLPRYPATFLKYEPFFNNYFFKPIYLSLYYLLFPGIAIYAVRTVQ